MKTALVTPFIDHLPLYPSTYLGYGAAYLRNEVELDIIDLNAEIYFRHKDIFKKIEESFVENPVVMDNLHFMPVYQQLMNDVEKEYERIPWSSYESVFITMPTWFPNIPSENVLKLANFIMQKSPETTISFFGYSLGSWTSENELRANGVNVVHINHLTNNHCSNKPVQYDALPIPVYEQREKYIFDILSFRLKHGCIWGKCKFCSLAKGWNAGYLERSAAKVIQEIEDIIDTYSPTMLACNDNSINGGNLLEFCGYFEQFNQPWAGMARADLTDKEIVALRKANCKMIYFGLESGSDRILNTINKGISVKQLSDFIKKLYDNDILPAPSLFVGAPGETKKDFESTIRFILDHKKYLSILNVYPFMVSPHSDYSLSMNESGPDDSILLRLKKMSIMCIYEGIKVCVGEQSAEYILYKEVYPDRVAYWADSRLKTMAGLESSKNSLSLYQGNRED